MASRSTAVTGMLGVVHTAWDVTAARDMTAAAVMHRTPPFSSVGCLEFTLT